ncbi:MAG: hypothetical protein ACYC6Y_18710 [Thermoguttaceae bacterium]
MNDPHRSDSQFPIDTAQIIQEEIPAPTLRKNVIKRLDSMISTLHNQHTP